MSEARRQRNESLDVLRCIAILLVLGRHYDYYGLWARAGWIGVDLFFVLSGFLISGLLYQDFKEHGRIDWKRFLIRRGFKIYPAFYVFLTAVAVGFLAQRRAVPERPLAVSVVFLQNYFDKDFPASMMHLWSLAVEEHFYVFLPLLLLAMVWVWRNRNPKPETRNPKPETRNPFEHVPAVFVVVAVACLGLRTWLVHGGASEFITETHMRVDSLFCGVTLGYFYHFKRRWFEKLTGHHGLLIAAACSAPAMILESNSAVMQTIGLTELFVGFGFLVAWSIGRRPRNRVVLLGYRAMAWAGFYSYSIYLWHTMAKSLLKHEAPTALMFWIYVTAAMAVGILMAKLIEVPALALREKWFPSMAKGAVSAGRDAEAEKPAMNAGTNEPKAEQTESA